MRTNAPEASPLLPLCAGGADDEDSRATVRVPLCGKHGEGRAMTLDAADWRHVQAEWGDRWCVLPVGKRGGYVAANRRAFRHLTQQPCGQGVALLSRLLMDAQPGEVIRYANGDTFDLRRSNLVKLNRAEARRWRAAHLIVSTPPSTREARR